MSIDKVWLWPENIEKLWFTDAKEYRKGAPNTRCYITDGRFQNFWLSPMRLKYFKWKQKDSFDWHFFEF